MLEPEEAGDLADGKLSSHPQLTGLAKRDQITVSSGMTAFFGMTTIPLRMT